MTGSTVTFKFSTDGSSWKDVKETDGSAVSYTVSADDVIRIDPSYFRPSEVEELLGDPKYAKNKLGWEPKITLEELVQEMIDFDMRLAKNERLIKDNIEI